MELPDDSLDEMFRTLEPLTNVNSEITRCILGEDEIADDASPGLHHVRRQMKITADKVHTQLNSILNSSRTMLQDAVITMRDGRTASRSAPSIRASSPEWSMTSRPPDPHSLLTDGDHQAKQRTP